MKLFLGVLFVIFAFAKGNQLPDGRIVGGHSTTIETYPYQLSLCLLTNHLCGASLLNENFAITAAHCTYGRKAGSLVLRAGSTIKDKGGKYLFIRTIYQHPGFNMKTVDNDVSVLKLKMPVVFTPSIQPVKLPQANTNIDHKQAVCTGWGNMSEEGNKATTLQAVEFEVFTDAQCKSIYNDMFTEHMICAGDMTGKKDACVGDSGGPLVVNGELVGLVSWGLGCAKPDHPGIYTKVTSELEFIQDALRK